MLFKRMSLSGSFSLIGFPRRTARFWVISWVAFNGVQTVLAPLWSWHTGNYFTPVINNDFSNSSSPQPRPDLICNPNTNAPHTSAHWINTSCFALPARGTFGNAGRNILLGPGYFNTNLSLVKDFHFTETRYLQFRAEFFNAFNHTNFTGISNLTAFTPVEAPINQPQTGTLDVSQIGQILSAFAPRQVQFALKVYF